MLRPILVAGAGVLLAATAAAQEVVIDFDDRAAPSCVFAEAERLTDQYLAQGVLFTAPVMFQEGAIVEAPCLPLVSGHSAPNIVGYVPGLAGLPLGMDFTDPVERVSIRATNWNRVDTITLTAYDAGAGVVGTAEVSTLGMVGPLQLLEVAGAGIVRAELTSTSDEIAVDDVRFLPEPVALEPVLYESANAALVVDPMNEVGRGLGPIEHAPGPGDRLYYRVDDGTGFPETIRIEKGGPGIRVLF